MERSNIIQAILQFFSAVGEAKRLLAENESLKARIKELEGPELPTDYPIYEIKWTDLVKEMEEMGLELMLKKEFVPDRVVRTTNEESWRKIAPFLVYPADEYVEQGCDCDNYAMRASVDASFLCKLEGCRQTWGDSKWGYHAYSLVVIGPAPLKYKLIENNAGAPYAGELLNFGDYEYMPKSWK